MCSSKSIIFNGIKYNNNNKQFTESNILFDNNSIDIMENSFDKNSRLSAAIGRTTVRNGLYNLLGEYDSITTDISNLLVKNCENMLGYPKDIDPYFIMYRYSSLIKNKEILKEYFHLTATRYEAADISIYNSPDTILFTQLYYTAGENNEVKYIPSAHCTRPANNTFKSYLDRESYQYNRNISHHVYNK